MKKPKQHTDLINKGYNFKRILKGFFKENGKEVVSPVWFYKSKTHSKFISRFGENTVRN